MTISKIDLGLLLLALIVMFSGQEGLSTSDRSTDRVLHDSCVGIAYWLETDQMSEDPSIDTYNELLNIQAELIGFVDLHRQRQNDMTQAEFDKLDARLAELFDPLKKDKFDSDLVKKHIDVYLEFAGEL